MIYLDTHAVVWLYLGEPERFGPASRCAIEENDVLISAAVVLELEYLHEIGRLEPPALEVVNELSRDINVKVCDLEFRKVIQYAIQENWVRDPFDRLIVANAKARSARLVSRDEKMRLNYPLTVW